MEIFDLFLFLIELLAWSGSGESDWKPLSKNRKPEPIHGVDLRKNGWKKR